MTLDPQSKRGDRAARNQVVAAALILYGTLFLLFATMPGSVVSWLQGLNTNPVQQGALRGAELVQRASDRTGLSSLYLNARATFLKKTETQ
jgi:hypothetical protein